MNSTIRSCRSLLHYSASSNLLLLPSHVFFFSFIVFFSSDWFFFIFSSSLLKFSLCPSIITSLLLFVLNSLSSQLFISVLLWFYLIWGIFLCLILFKFLFMNSGEIVTYPGLKGVSLCGSIPMQSACTQWLWWESWIWSEHRLCFSPNYAGSQCLGVR